MLAVEIILLVIAYTLIIITLFVQVICYKRNLESRETIAFTFSLLLLIVSLTVSHLLGQLDDIEYTNVFTLFAMVLVGMTTPLSSLAERQHNIPVFWKKWLIAFSLLLILLIGLGYFINALPYLQYVVAIFLGISVVTSMILIRLTKPQKGLAYREKADRMFAIAFLVIVPLSLLANFALAEDNYALKVGFTLPLVFILLAGSKLLDDLKRLSFFNAHTVPKEQHFKNYSLTEREKEIATLLAKGTPYKQIAEELHISMPTVKTHASNIYRKCGVKSRSELTLLLIS